MIEQRLMWILHACFMSTCRQSYHREIQIETKLSESKKKGELRCQEPERAKEAGVDITSGYKMGRAHEGARGQDHEVRKYSSCRWLRRTVAARSQA